MPIHKTHLDQATHNYSAANYVFSTSEDFYDWSATMAFYSAVHFVESVLDCLAEQGMTFKYFNHSVNIHHSDELSGNFSFVSNSGKPLYSPHKVRRELIEKNFIRISDSYGLLDDASWTQRYCNWKQVDKAKCRRLIEKHLSTIKEWHDNIVKMPQSPKIDKTSPTAA
jgi:hypothetical protein